MSELSAQKAGRKKDWPLTEGAFQRLLGWLDEGADSDGQKYLEMLRRLDAQLSAFSTTVRAGIGALEDRQVETQPFASQPAELP